MGDVLPFASVVIPARNEERFIGRCLDSILANDYPRDRLEVLVVDGRSTDATREIVQSYAQRNPCVRLLDNPRGIVSTAMNIGIKSACGDVIVRADAHSEYAPDYISECVRALEETGADNVGGPMRARADGFLGSAVALATSSPFGVGTARFHYMEEDGYVDTVYLGCFRRSVFERVGYFDEALVRNQDDELNLRITRSGGKIFLTPRIRSWYRPRSDLRSLARQYFDYGFWKVAVVRKHRLPASWRHLVPPAFVLMLGSGALAAPVHGTARVALGGIVGLYLAVSLAFSSRLAMRWGLRYLPVLPVVFATLHLSYGSGFLWAVLQWMSSAMGVRRRTARKAA